MSDSKTAISVKKNERQYLALVDNDGKQFHSFILDCQTKELTSKIQILADLPKSFIENISSSFENKGIKAVFFNIFRMKTSDYPNIVEYCKLIKVKFEVLKIPFYFINNKIYNITSFYIQSKLAAIEGDEIIDFVISKSNSTLINLLSYTKSGYKLIKCYYAEIDMSQNGKTVRDKLLENSHPKAIVVFNNGANDKKISFLEKFVFSKADNFILLNLQNFDNIEQNFLNEKLKWLNDKSCSKYHLHPFSYSEYVYFVAVGDKMCSRNVCDQDKLLPFTKKEYISNLNLDYFVGFIDGHTGQNVILQKVPYTKDAHKREITVFVDEQYFPDIQIKPIVMEEICKFPQTLNSKAKIPVIGFYDFFSSVICCFNEGKDGYEFIDGWNGVYGRPLFISFDKEKPTYCEAAVQVYKEKPSFVVSHLLSLMSADPENIKINDTWGFTLTKDSSNPILLEFDTYERTTKLATPSFLMAMLLKQHLKAINAELGEKPKELEFYLFDEFDSAAKQRIKEGLEEACKLLKTGFVMLEF